MPTALARAFLFWCLLFAAACAREAPQLVLSGPTMGTTYTVKVVSPPATLDAAALLETIDAVLADIDRTMSGYRPDSEVARFNASASTDWFDVSADLAAVVRVSLEVSEASAGAFDVTVAPLVAAWGFGPHGAPPALPAVEQLAQIGASVGYRKLHARVDPPALRKDVGALTIDLNGIAPGFAVDRLAERLQSLQVENFMIDIGGEIRARGRNARGQPWRIGIEQPVDSGRTPHAGVQLDDAAVATSGEYRHYYVHEGRRYSHTIDPRTARPLEREPGSVVVIAASAAHSDAWATALNVLGPVEGYALAARRRMPVLFISRETGQWRSRSTPQFEPYFAQEAAGHRMLRPSRAWGIQE
jgi:FAD:protein FMN transferase